MLSTVITEGINGIPNIPGDKSISHRSIIIPSISNGVCEFQYILKSDDVLHTIEAIKAMGVNIEENGKKLISNFTNYEEAIENFKNIEKNEYVGFEKKNYSILRNFFLNEILGNVQIFTNQTLNCRNRFYLIILCATISKIIAIGDINKRSRKNIHKNILTNAIQKVIKNFGAFIKVDNNQEYIFEVKTVPLAYYVDVPKKEYKKHQTYIDSCEFNEKIAYFPDGYRKNANEPVSPRALKHIQELEKIALTTNISCNLIYVVQRTDINYFQTSNIDLIYKKAVQKAWLNGVQIKVLQIKWNEEGKAYLHSNSLPIHLFDYYGPYTFEDL